MGSYTSTHRFYKPAADELVDVENQINYNLRRADERVRAIVEWRYTENDPITGNDPRVYAYKYFKAATNCTMLCYNTSLQMAQPTTYGDTDPWSNSGITFSSPWQTHPTDQTLSLCYRKEPTDGMVYWRGLIMNGSWGNITRNTNIVVATIPTSARPSRNKYSWAQMGNDSAGWSACRVQFKTTGEIEINRMGVSSMSSTYERYISFNDISYPTNDV